MLPISRGVVAVCSLLTLAACNAGLPNWTTPQKPTQKLAQKEGIEKVILKKPVPHDENLNLNFKARKVDLIATIPPDTNPRNLIGLESHGLADKLGSPDFVRRDRLAEVWQYSSKSCILDVFLYRTDGKLLVDYVELRGRGTAALSRQDCYLKMLQTHLMRKQG